MRKWCIDSLPEGATSVLANKRLRFKWVIESRGKYLTWEKNTSNPNPNTNNPNPNPNPNPKQTLTVTLILTFGEKPLTHDALTHLTNKK